MTAVTSCDVGGRLPPAAFDGIEAVCFDAFGTLVEIADRHGAFRQLFKAVPAERRAELKHRLMREQRSISDWMEAYGVEADPLVALDIHGLVLAEVSSVALRPGMADIWARLRAEGLRLAICSNLASSYGVSVRRVLPDAPDVEVFSYKAGAIKPEPEIYRHVLDGLSLDPGRVLFVGDTVRTDIEGPRAMGMKAMHVRELELALKPTAH